MPWANGHASASSAHNKSPTAIRNNAASRRSFCARGTIPVQAAADACTATLFACTEGKIVAIIARLGTIEPFIYAAESRPDLSQSVARAHAAGDVPR